MPLARIALIFAGLVALFGLVYGVSVYTAVGRRLADSSLRGAIAARPLFFGTVSKILDVVSVASLLGAVALVAVIALVRLARLEGLLAVGILVCSNISTWLLKTVLLTRPDLGLHEIAPATLNSMPSGHATAVFSSVAALLFVAPRRWRGVSATAGAGFAAVTGLATMLAGWHRAGDSVAAFLLEVDDPSSGRLAAPVDGTRRRPRPRLPHAGQRGGLGGGVRRRRALRRGGRLRNHRRGPGGPPPRGDRTHLWPYRHTTVTHLGRQGVRSPG
jgi:membrane-associated phospholipid phosphatase